MKRFLQQCALSAAAACGGRSATGVTLVVGNEAADADSIVSSLCLAYLKNYAEKKSGGNRIYLPVTCVPRSSVHLRRDVELLLSLVGLSLDQLICANEISFDLLKFNSDVSVILVDQNTVPACSSCLSSSVIEILDHHIDSGQSCWVQGGSRNIAFDAVAAKPLVGSTCTLIAESYLSTGMVAEEVATLLLGVIALDTFNMDPVIAKGTDRDAHAMSALQSIVSKHSAKDLFVLLRDAKLDINFWRSLSAEDALGLDYKVFHSSNGFRTGVSSVLLPINELLNKDNMVSCILSIMERDGLRLFAAMALFSGETTRRELLCFSPSDDVSRATSFFIGGECSSAGLTQTGPGATLVSERGSEYGFVVFAQSNVAYSRKQMAQYFISFGNLCSALTEPAGPPLSSTPGDPVHTH